MASFVILEALPDAVKCEVTLDDGTVFTQQVRGNAKATLAAVSDAVSAAAQEWIASRQLKTVDPDIVAAIKQRTAIALALPVLAAKLV